MSSKHVRGEHVGYPEYHYPKEGNFLSRNFGKIFLLGTLAVAAAGSAYALRNMGETVYEGTINGTPVRYEEGRFNWGLGDAFTKNELTVDNGSIGMVFTDYLDEVSVYEPGDEDNGRVNNSRLEELTFLQDGRVVQKINRDEAGDHIQTPMGNIPTERFFQAADGLYDMLRYMGKDLAEKGVNDIMLMPQIIIEQQ
jgi:hypothetical protein